ncbi:MAG: hypothetical protein RJB08_762, partial [Actinomycetota bacterium]
MPTTDTFPRQHARTQRLTLGEPRNVTVSPDGNRIIFARSATGSDPVNLLWSYDVATHTETCLFDPRASANANGDLTPEELRRRERAREGAGGVVAYACDSAVTIAATVLGGQLFVVDLIKGGATTVPVEPGVFDARLSPDGSRVAYTRRGRLFVSDLTGDERQLAGDDDPNVTWGLAEFIAAEEMGRLRGYWWSPDGRHIAATRVDNAPVDVWYIADPANPAQPATEHRYPAAGSTNANVELFIVDTENASRTKVDLPPHEYLNSVSWTTAGLIAQVQNRDQRAVVIVRIDPATGSCTSIGADSDSAWVELVPGTPALTTSGQLVTCIDRTVRRLAINGKPVTPDNLQVRSVAAVADDVVFVANDISTPWYQSVHRWRNGALETIADGEKVHVVLAAGPTVVLRETSFAGPRASFRVIAGVNEVAALESHAEEMLVRPNVRIVEVAGCAVAIVSPNDGGHDKLPVLFDPYGGPHAQRVVGSQFAFASSQWFADQGFIVVVADGRGTPGRGSAYERAVFGDLAQPVIDDQVAVLDALPSLEPR